MVRVGHALVSSMRLRRRELGAQSSTPLTPLKGRVPAVMYWEALAPEPLSAPAYLWTRRNRRDQDRETSGILCAMVFILAEF